MINNNLPSGYHQDFQLLKKNSIYSIESIKEILDVFTHSIEKIIVKYVNLQDEEYKYLFTVDSINELAMQANLSGKLITESENKFSKEVMSPQLKKAFASRKQRQFSFGRDLQGKKTLQSIPSHTVNLRLNIVVGDIKNGSS